MHPFTVNLQPVSQLSCQLFHGPAPRSPLRLLSVRLRRSRSNTSTEHTSPECLQLYIVGPCYRIFVLSPISVIHSECVTPFFA